MYLSLFNFLHNFTIKNIYSAQYQGCSFCVSYDPSHFLPIVLVVLYHLSFQEGRCSVRGREEEEEEEEKISLGDDTVYSYTFYLLFLSLLS